MNGRFNVVIGPKDTDGDELAAALPNNSATEVYLQIQRNGQDPISPRQRLLHAPLALRSEFANHANTATAVGSPGSSAINILGGKLVSVQMIPRRFCTLMALPMRVYPMARESY